MFYFLFFFCPLSSFACFFFFRFTSPARLKNRQKNWNKKNWNIKKKLDTTFCKQEFYIGSNKQRQIRRDANRRRNTGREKTMLYWKLFIILILKHVVWYLFHIFVAVAGTATIVHEKKYDIKLCADTRHATSNIFNISIFQWKIRQFCFSFQF